MTEIHLWDNTTGPPSTQTETVAREIGVQFSSTLAYYVTGLRWYAANTTASDVPQRLDLWHNDSQTLVASASTMLGAGTVGWHDVPLDVPYRLEPGAVYTIAFGAIANVYQEAYQATTSPAPYPLAFYSPRTRFASPGTPGVFPASTQDANVWYVDVVVSDVLPPSPDEVPPLAGDVRDAFRAWFDPATADFPIGDAKLYPRVAQALDSFPALASTNTALDWDKVQKLWQIAGALADAEIAAWNLFAQRAPSQLTGASGGGGSAFYGPGGTQVSAGVEALYQRAINAQVGFPAAPWQLDDETDWDTSLAWAVPADLYVITATDLGSGIVNTVVGGVDVSYRLAWWSPLNGAFAQHRRFIDTPGYHAVDPAGRMPGLLLHSPQGASGHVQAWTLQI